MKDLNVSIGQSSIALLLCLAALSGCSRFLPERSLDARYCELPFDEAQWKAERYVWVQNSTRENMSKELGSAI